MRHLSLLLSFWLLMACLQAQTIARFEVDAGDTDRKDIFVNAPVQLTAACRDNGMQLFEVSDKVQTSIPFQIEQTEELRIWWQVEGILKQGDIRIFELRAGGKKTEDAKVPIQKDDQSYILFNSKQPVLHYNYAKAPLPEGVDKAYARSGYIHPLFSPSGKMLTTIQPPDHIHHYGLWNAWTRTQFKGRQVDFWNLGEKQGRVDYIRTILTDQGEVFQSLKTMHHHVALKEKGGSDLALKEELEVRVFCTDKDFNVIDYTTSFYCAHPDGILLEEYRYGGFAFRGSEAWSGHSVEMLTSEGHNQDNSDGHPAKWCMINEKGNNPSGILIMSHPANYNHPEPLRTWDAKANGGQANIFINFSPIRTRNWEMTFGQPYTLQYRVITFDGRWTREDAEQAWIDFSNAPTVKVLQ